MNYEVAKEYAVLSDEEKITFPQVIHKLLDADIELYYTDLLSSNKTYYSKNTAYTVECSQKHKKVADIFNAQEVVSAIRQAQSGEIQYQEFLQKIMDAGVIGCLAFIKGRRVIYFGRRGEQYIEDFPK
jgi:uncharacterized protein YbcV (DUF1398 family)